MTIKEIADQAGVSPATVSNVLNNTKFVHPDKRERVLAIVKEKQYTPNHIAKSLRTNRTKTIGILAEDINAVFTPSIIYGITDMAEKKGYNIVLNDLHFLERLYNRYEEIHKYRKKINEAVRYLLSARVDGIIYIGMNDRYIDGIIDPVEKPLVYTYCYSSVPGNIFVSYDNKRAAYEAMTNLIQKGHISIGIIKGPENSIPSQLRMEGILKAVNDTSGVGITSKNGDWEYQSGYDQTIELFGDSMNITAIFALNDIMAAGVIDAIVDSGKSVPRDISVIGFDDREISWYLKPKLSTVALPLKEMGQLSVDLLIKNIENQEIEKKGYLIPCTHIERKSLETR